MSYHNSTELIRLDDYVASGYTWQFSSDTIAYNLQLTIPRDGTYEPDIDSSHNFKIAGVTKNYKLVEYSAAPHRIQASLVSREFDIAQKTLTKEWQFMSFTASEYSEFLTYLSNAGFSIGQLKYVPAIRLYSWDFSTRPPTISSDTTQSGVSQSGWWAFRSGFNYVGQDADTIMGVVCSWLGLDGFITNLPGFRVRSFTVPAGASILDALRTLFNMYEPLTYVYNNKLYIIDRTAAQGWQGILSFKTVKSAEDKRLYKEAISDVILTGGSVPFDSNYFEGAVNLHKRSYSGQITTAYPAKAVFDTFSVDYYGDIIEEASATTTTDPVYGAVSGSTKQTFVGRDILQTERFPIHEVEITYGIDEMRYNQGESVLTETTRRATYNRVRFTDGIYAGPRIDSMSENDKFVEINEDNYTYTFPTTKKNWASFTSYGKRCWDYSTSPAQYKMVDDIEWQIRWVFYDKTGRLAYEEDSTFGTVWTSGHLSPKWEEFIASGVADIRHVQTFRFAETPVTAPITGTIIPLILPDGTENWWNNPFCWVDRNVKWYFPINATMHKIVHKRRFLDPQSHRFRETVVEQIVPTTDIPISRTALQPREMNLVLKPSYYYSSNIVDRPAKVLSHPHLWTMDDALAAYQRANMLYSNQSAEFERKIEVPYPIYIPRGAMLSFGPLRGPDGRIILNGRNAYGIITDAAITRTSGDVSTTITAKGIT